MLVGRPDATGREAILRIHAEKMRESGRLALDGMEQGVDGECSLERVGDDAYEAWIRSLAAKTEGFSGAALAAVVRAAVARALDRSVGEGNAVACRVSLPRRLSRRFCKRSAAFHGPSTGLPLAFLADIPLPCIR